MQRFSLFRRSPLLSLFLAASLSVVASACSSSPEVPGGDPAGDGDGDGDGDQTGDGDGDGDIDLGNTGGTTTDPSPDAGECGNGKLEELELCDDGNTKKGDGCNADCSTIDPDYLCLEAGEKCERVVICGNGILEGDEVCDDGEEDPDDGDGCGADCKTIEGGFTCIKPGQPCVPSPVCGNGIRERGEQCDDGEETPDDGDGCDASCQEEDSTAWFCPPGSACLELTCGDGIRTPDEECDDGEATPDGGDGCDANCALETGWRCGSSGCRPICGDGLLLGGEECDDSDLTSGDGCSAACKEEPFYSCPDAAGDCTSDIVCGDGCVDPGEICDPGNLSNDCGEADAACTSTIEDPSKACKGFEIEGDSGFCGDGTVNFGEECDSDCGLTCDIPGCTACEIDEGWSCRGAGNCFKIPACGDGEIQIGEECDPGPISDPGCNPSECTIEDDHYCSGVPSVCVDSVCGDGFVAPDEQCDDGPGTTPGVPGTAMGGDGCSTLCEVETGYVCPPGLDCQPTCGNGTKEPEEECDEVSAGCTNCFINPGYDCDSDGKNCALNQCGSENSGTPVVERGEGCDDGNDIAGDGCSPTCQVEPTFTHDSSGTPTNTSPSCGDGFKTLAEGCDDGNQTNGDGCSSSCEEESGWTCVENAIEYPDSIDFRVTYRDFQARQDSGGHPHFKRTNTFDSGTDRGIVGQLCSTSNYDSLDPGSDDCGLLDSDGKPQNVKGVSTTIVDHTDAFALWYRDSNPTNIVGENGVIELYANPGTTAEPTVPPTTPDTITLNRVGTTSAYDFDDNSFFDLDDRGFGNTESQSHNFNFTTELRYFFQYQGGEELLFEGDDDVWVFVNGRLAVDVGGIHCEHVGRVILGDEDGSCNLQLADNECSIATYDDCATYSTTEQDDTTDNRFGITKGEVYEIVLFHAERNPTGSNFRLTLDGFLAPRSTCSVSCGDGIRAGNEICDTDSDLTEGYNVCLNDCSIDFCGDGVVQDTYDDVLMAVPEACDDAVKVTYQADGTGCGFDCQPAPYCGDGEVQAFAGEVCDDGKNDGSYGSCATDCKDFGGYCGDGVVDPEEDCDSPTKVVYQEDGMGCGYDCKWAPYCGDGERNGTETCEPPGTAECDDSCQVLPFCGDGIVSVSTEQCDYASFNAAPESVEYGGCDTNCELGPRCGDMEIQSAAGEECDDGEMNSPAESATYDSCTTACLLGPRCGDGIQQSAEEACDNGFNEDTYAYSEDACGPDCTAVPYCGDGIVDPAIEQCDDGVENSDTAYDGCREDCFWGPYCGDGQVNGSEECDDPDGNVAYSAEGEGCSFDCKENVPFCGDGVRNGPEQCDLGTAKNTGDYDGCKEDCSRAPYCGDGKVNGNEACDDGPTGSLECTQTCARRVVAK